MNDRRERAQGYLDHASTLDNIRRRLDMRKKQLALEYKLLDAEVVALRTEYLEVADPLAYSMVSGLVEREF